MKRVTPRTGRISASRQRATSLLIGLLSIGVLSACTWVATERAGEPTFVIQPPATQVPVTQPPVRLLAVDLPGRLSVQPARLVYSAPSGQASAAQTVVVSNSGTSPFTLGQLELSDVAAGLELLAPPNLPLTLAAGQELHLSLRLTAGGLPGVRHLSLLAGEGRALTPLLGLNVLRTRGEQGDLEPTLAQIADTLGYHVNVGSAALLLGTGADPIGNEVQASLFQRATPGPVRLEPVARYSPSGLVTYGTFTLNGAGVGAAAQTTARATIADGQEQTLNPAVQAGGSLSFDPGGGAFGVYLAANSYAPQPTYTLDRLNTGRTTHAFRVYPLVGAADTAGPTRYLLAAETAINGDYQDAVFVLENVRPLAPGAGQGRSPVQGTPLLDDPS
jgi:hypothetical protein